MEGNQPQPETSRDDYRPEDRVDRIIREAEQGRAKIYQTPGKVMNYDVQNVFVHSAMVNEDYYVLAAHLDQSVRDKIEKGEYIDLAKLIPKDRMVTDEEQKLQMIVKNGQSFWVPIHEGTAITNYQKWEQAFRIYTDVFVCANPSRSSELIQYAHIINTIASQFVWENVYAYDKDFRLHMSRHPARSWSLILHQAWALRLHDKLRTQNQHNDYHDNYKWHGGKGKTRDNYCLRYNKTGKCTYGKGCHFDHRCKFGHPICHCRKLQVDKLDKSEKWSEKIPEDILNNLNTNNHNNSGKNNHSTK